jgi:hypothetical protein
MGERSDNRTETGFKRKGIIEHLDTLVACFVAGDGCTHTITFCRASAVICSRRG